MQLITNPEVRAKHLDRTDVLNRVGGLLVLPNTELATTNMVAHFYGVPVNTIYSVIHDNRDELENNGMKNMSYKELKEVVFNPSQKKGLEIDSEIKLSRRGSTVFSKRAILNVGFMLRDSKVALEVRNQALNIILNATDEQKVYEINQEKELYMGIMFAQTEVERDFTWMMNKLTVSFQSN